MIETSVEQSCMTLTINRPERRNALTGQMYADLNAGLQAAQQDASCRAVILTGTSDYFSAGNDLSEFQAAPTVVDSPALAFLRTLASIDVPVIAAVEGHAIGVGVTLLQHCDFVYAGQSAMFTMPFVSLGLCPEGGSSLLMARLVGARRAAEWLLLGKPFSADEAYDSGFITAVAPQGQALTAARTTARALSELPPAALRASKRLMREGHNNDLTKTFDIERDVFTERLQSAEAQHAFQKFFERKAK
jgi:enoyl-CoA hydratase/carnithine racemase